MSCSGCKTRPYNFPKVVAKILAVSAATQNSPASFFCDKIGNNTIQCIVKPPATNDIGSLKGIYRIYIIRQAVIGQFILIFELLKISSTQGVVIGNVQGTAL